MICPHCNKENNDIHKYCLSCGQWMPDEPEESDLETTEEEETEEEEAEEKTSFGKDRKKSEQTDHSKVVNVISLFLFSIMIASIIKSQSLQGIVIGAGYVGTLFLLLADNGKLNAKSMMPWFIAGILLRSFLITIFSMLTGIGGLLGVRIIASLPGLVLAYIFKSDRGR